MVPRLVLIPVEGAGFAFSNLSVPTPIRRKGNRFFVIVFQVKPNLTFQVDIGSASDIEGVTEIVSYEQAGLFVPGISISISTKEDKVVKELWEGNNIKVLYGRSGKLDIFGEYVINRVELRRETNYWNAVVLGVHKGISFSVKGKPRFFENKSKDVLVSVLGEYFQVKDEAKPTDDKMVWIQPRFYSDKAFCLHVWQHSWYPGNNLLLIGIHRDGKAHLVDLETLAQREDVRIGTLVGYKRFIGNFSWMATSDIANAFNASSVGEWNLLDYKYSEHNHDYKVLLGIKDPQSFLGDKQEVYRYMVSDNVHRNYNASLAKNTEILAKLSSISLEILWEVCSECKSGELNDDRPILKLFQVVKFGIEEANKSENPKDSTRSFLPASGKYIISGIKTFISPGNPITQSLTLVRDSFRS